MASRCRGFRFAGVGCGIKSSGALDLGLIACDGPASAAAVFTDNRLAAAPVRVSKRALKASASVSAIVVNSGNANACTGEAGTRDARSMQKQAAHLLGVKNNQVLVASTGVIGQPLPMDRIDAGIDAAAAALASGGFDQFSRSILTTDRGPKQARRTLKSRGGISTLLGCTKGAGMIAPNMATTLTFVATDVDTSSAVLERVLRAACAETFNAITVDGDTSTNDMIAVLASGASGVKLSSRASIDSFSAALTELLAELATKLMHEGEGVNHVATIVVRGARDRVSARRVARAVAISPLVKTAIAGCDPNWGRILCAVGNAGVALTSHAISLDIGRVAIVRNGIAVAARERAEGAAAAVMKRARYTMTIDLGRGDATAHYLACDLSHEYVSINADYRT